METLKLIDQSAEQLLTRISEAKWHDFEPRRQLISNQHFLLVAINEVSE